MTKLKVSVIIDSDLKTVWDKLTNPIHITKWNAASEDWHCPFAENDLRVGGKFKSRMEAKDGSFGFDFEGVYTNVNEFNSYQYKLADDRVIDVFLKELKEGIEVTEIFDPENENPYEMQEMGWQSILNKFKDYCEA